MSDPRLNDTRPTDPTRRPRVSSSPTWLWLGGIAAVVLIAILVMGNWHTGTDTGTPVTANDPAVTTPAGSPPARNVTPSTTTGAGGTSPAPAQPATPAPAPNQQ